MSSPGSSPLTRGKRLHERCAEPYLGLIPAHAGKTLRASLSSALSRAHPRSRGENKIPDSLISFFPGSSPLTRGKLCQASTGDTTPRLIPAHAGKTRVFVRKCRPARAHPRSRGENVATTKRFNPRPGSSPLTRGKRDVGGVRSGCCGLIPAHAGKTCMASVQSSLTGAHPRSRGENTS